MVKFGAMIFATDKCIPAVDLAVELERRGLDSFFVPEHTHIPNDTSSPFFDGMPPEFYLRTFDPFVVLGQCAAVTKKILLGTGICLVSQRHPITLAKEVATIDRLSGGRFVFGIGAGWNKPEVENHGAPFAKRWQITRERILAMKEIWTKDEAEFHGEYVSFDKMWSYPKPIQKGGPPIWIGANAKFVEERVAEYGDGWIPIGGRKGGATVEGLKQACEAVGRDITEITLAYFFAPLNQDEIQANIDKGFTHFIFNLPSEGKDVVMPALDKIAKIIEKFKTC